MSCPDDTDTHVSGVTDGIQVCAGVQRGEMRPWSPIRRCRLHASLDFLIAGVPWSDRSVRERMLVYADIDERVST